MRGDKQNPTHCAKKRLEWVKGKWVDELPRVLWAYQTTPGWPTGTTPFAFAYGMKVVIPIEIGMSIAKTVVQGQRDENHELERHLDWADEVRGNAAIHMGRLSTKSYCPLQ